MDDVDALDVDWDSPVKACDEFGLQPPRRLTQGRSDAVTSAMDRSETMQSHITRDRLEAAVQDVPLSIADSDVDMLTLDTETPNMLLPALAMSSQNDRFKRPAPFLTALQPSKRPLLSPLSQKAQQAADVPLQTQAAPRLHNSRITVAALSKSASPVQPLASQHAREEHREHQPQVYILQVTKGVH